MPAKGGHWSKEQKKVLSLQKIGDKNPMWKGDKAGSKAAHTRARNRFPCPEGMELHHIDGDPWNNSSENIEALTRREHMIKDGRLDKLIIFDYKKSSIDNLVFMDLYNQGLSDKQIADRLGVSINCIWSYRERRELQKHRRVLPRGEKNHGWKGDLAKPESIKARKYREFRIKKVKGVD